MHPGAHTHVYIYHVQCQLSKFWDKNRTDTIYSTATTQLLNSCTHHPGVCNALLLSTIKLMSDRNFLQKHKISCDFQFWPNLKLCQMFASYLSTSTTELAAGCHDKHNHVTNCEVNNNHTCIERSVFTRWLSNKWMGFLRVFGTYYHTPFKW